MPQRDIGPDELDDGYGDTDIPRSAFSMMTGTLVMVGVVTLLIFTGLIWYAFNVGGDHAGDGTLAVINAEPGDIKVRPDDPGGTNFAHQDKTVYDKIDGNEAGLEQLLPEAEEPKEKPTIISPYNNELPEDGQPRVVRVPPPATGATPLAPAAAPEVVAPEIPDPMGRKKADTEQDDVVAAEPVPPVSSAAPDDADQVAALINQEDEASEPVSAEAESVPQRAALEASPVTTPPAAALAGKIFALQLGAFRTQGAADAGWKLLAGRHAGILGELEHYVTEADLGERGRFFRLQAGPFPERASANTQCAALKAAGADCIVVAR
ncbi:MAG: SPOR domain-containing protein [Alphaproteobacteria bacterium]